MAAFFSTYGFLLVSMLFAAMLGLSLYLPLMAGQLSLAAPGFYALGGYMAAVLSTQVFPSADGTYSLALVLLEMVVAAVASGILAILVDLPGAGDDCLRRDSACVVTQLADHGRGSRHLQYSAAVPYQAGLFLAGGPYAADQHPACLPSGTYPRGTGIYCDPRG